MRIFTKLFLSHSLLGLIVVVALAVIFYSLLRQSLIQRSLEQLSSINKLKKDLVESYFARSMQNLEAIKVEDKFLRIYNSLVLHTTFGSGVHDLADMETLRSLYDFKNIHFFDAQHRQLFSTDKQTYPQKLVAAIDTMVAPTPTAMSIVDVSNYGDDDDVLLFYYVPIVDSTGVIGSVLIQENLQKIWKILLETTGMGQTGESYLVGHDYRMRSPSRFFPDHSPESIPVITDATEMALNGEEGLGILADYRGISVLSVYRPIDLNAIHWAIVTEMDEEEAMQPILILRNYFIMVALASIALTMVITYYISNRIVGPIQRLKEIIMSLSRGVIPRYAHPGYASDEIGEISQAIALLADGLERTTVFASEIGSGNLSVSFEKLSEEDQLGLALLQMRDELRRFHDEELRATRARAAALLEGQESERRRIIKELHDGVGQMLTAIRMQVDMNSALEGKEEIKKMINDTINEVKRISYNVMPQAIVDFGLEAALRGLCDSVRRFWSGTIDFRYIKEVDLEPNFEVSIAIFRIAQEGLNNAIRHADASTIKLYVVSKGDELYMLIEDNGKGFDTEAIEPVKGSGLRNIRERSILLNGEVSIEASQGEGTTIEVHIPMSS